MMRLGMVAIWARRVRGALAVAIIAACLDGGTAWGRAADGARDSGKKVIVIGFDGMDPRLSEELMDAGKLPNFDRLRQTGGYRPLRTSNPPQSPVAWATFINGAGPGTHGIFDFIHRNPERQYAPFYSAAETVEGEGSWEVGDHQLQIEFWPFNHTPTKTLLRREGKPFWDYLDEAGIKSAFYDLPANYPPSPSAHHNHCCLSGMGTPDMLGTYGTYQHYAEDGPVRTRDEGGGKRSRLTFINDTARGKLIGPADSFRANPKPVIIEFLVHRDVKSDAVAIDIQEQRIILKKGEWSPWLQLDIELSMPKLLPNQHISGICRFFLQEVSPNLRLYVTPLNIDPTDPAVQVTEPLEFIEEIADDLGLFYTSGFQEDHKALSNKVFTDAEYLAQAQIVLEERLNLLRYAVDNYSDGLLFFYFSSTDLQAHMFWWDSDEKHPIRSDSEAQKYFAHVKNIYQEMDKIIGKVLRRFGDEAVILLLSDHGFCNFERQFNLNTWLRDNGYVQPATCSHLLSTKVNWSATRAYGLGLNGLYINLKGRERDGIVDSGPQYESLVTELIEKLEAVRDVDGERVICKVYRTDEVYSGPHTYLAPDLLIGYCRDYRASWATTLGEMSADILSDNDSAWSADHCIDPVQVPGVVFSNRPIRAGDPGLEDIAPTILSEFGVEIPDTMTGKSIYTN